jgi:acid phosphatase family membrane protein YuiD
MKRSGFPLTSGGNSYLLRCGIFTARKEAEPMMTLPSTGSMPFEHYMRESSLNAGVVVESGRGDRLFRIIGDLSDAMVQAMDMAGPQ